MAAMRMRMSMVMMMVVVVVMMMTKMMTMMMAVIASAAAAHQYAACNATLSLSDHTSKFVMQSSSSRTCKRVVLERQTRVVFVVEQ